MYHRIVMTTDLDIARRSPQSAMDWLERLGIGASLLCLVHCLALPFALAALPALSSVLAIPESFHLWILAFALPTSGFALISGRWRHRAFYPLAIGVVGLILLALGAIPLGSTPLETPVTVVGGLMLAAAHLTNWQLRHAMHRHG